MQKKVWYYEKWVGRQASFSPRSSVKYLKIGPNWQWCLAGSSKTAPNKFYRSKKRVTWFIKRLYFFNRSQKSCSFLYHNHKIWNMPLNFFPSGFFRVTFQVLDFVEKIWDPRKSRSTVQIEFSRSKNSISWFWTSRKS